MLFPFFFGIVGKESQLLLIIGEPQPVVIIFWVTQHPSDQMQLDIRNACDKQAFFFDLNFTIPPSALSRIPRTRRPQVPIEIAQRVRPVRIRIKCHGKILPCHIYRGAHIGQNFDRRHIRSDRRTRRWALHRVPIQRKDISRGADHEGSNTTGLLIDDDLQ